jgi:hypothetical protein
MTHENTARALLRLYPAAWRERYGDELLALIDQSGLTFRIVLDVVLAAGVEWIRFAAALIRGEHTSAEPPPKLITVRYMFADFFPRTAIVSATVLLFGLAGVPFPKWNFWINFFFLLQNNHPDGLSPRHPSRSARLFVWCYWFGLAVALSILGWGLGSALLDVGVPEPSTVVFYTLGAVFAVGFLRCIYFAYRWMSYNSTWPGLHPREIRFWQAFWFAVVVVTAMAEPSGEAFWPWTMVIWLALRPPYDVTRAGVAQQRALKEERDRQSPWPQI